MSAYSTVFRRPTSQTELAIGWTYPVWTEGASVDGRSTSVRANQSLPAAEALAFIAGDDPRPLLVLRECLTCTGTDDALLTRQADNEKTMLMSRWFHCVKLPPDVLDEGHAFKNLFTGDDPSHLFVVTADGKERLDLNGAQSRTELWSVMEKMLTTRYAEKPDKALKALLRVLDDYDEVDERIALIEEKLDDAVESEGPGSSRAKKLKKELTKLHQERNDLRAKAVKVSELKVKKPKRA
jgi:hypothetical protein